MGKGEYAAVGDFTDKIERRTGKTGYAICKDIEMYPAQWYRLKKLKRVGSIKLKYLHRLAALVGWDYLGQCIDEEFKE